MITVADAAAEFRQTGKVKVLLGTIRVQVVTLVVRMIIRFHYKGSLPPKKVDFYEKVS